MIFTPNPCNQGFAACVTRDKFDKEKEPKKANYFFPRHKILVDIGHKAANNRIVVDQFILMSTLYNPSNMSIVSYLPRGQVEYYNYSMDPVTQMLYLKNCILFNHYLIAIYIIYIID